MKILPLIASIFILLPMALFAQDTDWYNTQGEGPYTISTADELKGLQSLVANNTQNFSGKTIKLAGNIALTGNWTPIGSQANPFQGIFDGQMHTISGLSVNGGTYVGLFGYVGEDGQIKNLNVVGTKIKATGSADASFAVGGLAGIYLSSKPIENCSVKADSVSAVGVSGTRMGYAGGLVGYAHTITINNSYTSANINCNVGAASRGNSGASAYAGGLVGFTTKKIIITNSYANRNVISKGGNGNTGTDGGNGIAGGLVGALDAGGSCSITKSYASGNVAGIGGYSNNEGVEGIGIAGGLAGSCGSITNSYASGSVYADGYIGNANTTSWFSIAGGLVGSCGSITNSYASGNVSTNGYDYSGGLVGEGTGCKINNSYASGSAGGGIYGYSHAGYDPTLQFVYYNSTETSKIGVYGSSIGGMGKTSAELKKQATFVNWDFNGTWGIVEGVTYPFLNDVYVFFTDIKAEYVADHIYTGSEIKPEPKIILRDGTSLSKDVDYELSYKNNKNAGTGTVIITGKGAYSTLNETISFKIVPRTITITDANADKIYDGTTTATITGTLEGLVEGDNVSISGKFASKNAGTKIAVSNVTLTGTNASNYTLTPLTSLTANITKKDLLVTLDQKTVTITSSEAMSVANSKIIYDGRISGESLSGSASIFRNGSQLSSNPGIGTYEITLGGLSATNNANYNIIYDTDLQLIVTAAPVNLSTCTITNISSQAYTSEQIKPDVAVSCGSTTLVLTTDYTLTYGENKNAGTGTVTVTGIGAYTGSVNKTFTISKKALTVTGTTAESKVYDGTTVATIKGAELSGVFEADATLVSLANNTTGTFASANVGTDIAVSTSMSLTGTAAGNYSITQPTGLKADITPKPLPSDAIQEISAQAYTASAITPDVVVKDGTVTLAKDTDYTLVFSSNTNLGTATVRAVGKGNYSDVATASFAINAKALSINMVTPILPQLHTGNVIEPAIEIKNGSVQLVAGTDYDVEYENNVAIGTATVIVTGKGNYTGEINITFEITSPIQSSSSTIAKSSSSSSLPSSSSATPSSSSSSNASTPILTPQTAILLSNLPQGAKVEVYNLQGKRIYSAYPENPRILRIGVQTGVYIVKIGSKTMKVAVR